MDTHQMVKQMLGFNKTVFVNTLNAIVMIEEQNQRRVKRLMEHAACFPEEGKQVIKEWMEASKLDREHFHRVLEEGFKQVEEFFDTPQDPDSAPDIQRTASITRVTKSPPTSADQETQDES